MFLATRSFPKTRPFLPGLVGISGRLPTLAFALYVEFAVRVDRVEHYLQYAGGQAQVSGSTYSLGDAKPRPDPARTDEPVGSQPVAPDRGQLFTG